jgi:hypothetical protein
LAQDYERRNRGKTPRQLDARWFLYPAYTLTLGAGGVASQFAVRSQEWAVGPVVVAWGLLLVWYWLYSVAFHYRRPLLKYFGLAGALGFGGLLTTFCLDRAPPQYAASDGGAVFRSFEFDLVWAGVATGVGALLVGLHAILFSRAR